MDRLQGELNHHTFLSERYLPDGAAAAWAPSRFFEYPAVTAVLLREVRYGIRLGLDEVVVDPFLPRPARFAYHLGNVHVDYDDERGAILQLPWPEGEFTLRVTGLAHAAMEISVDGALRSSSSSAGGTAD